MNRVDELDLLIDCFEKLPSQRFDLAPDVIKGYRELIQICKHEIESRKEETAKVN